MPATSAPPWVRRAIASSSPGMSMPGISLVIRPPSSPHATTRLVGSSGALTTSACGAAVRNVTVSANGGQATANAQGGDGNVAVSLGGQANAGNGGTATAEANGGTIEVGAINSGGNTGNVIETGNLSGNTTIDGGTSTNTTTVDLSANGGTATSNARGGDNNAAGALGGQANAGNGGTATSEANGGTIEVGTIDSGGNTGNVISVGN